MKKTITLILALVLCFSLAVTANAELGYDSYVLMPQAQDYFGDGMEENNEEAAKIANKYDLVISCAVFDGKGDSSSQELTEELYMSTYGGYDGIMLCYFWEEGEIFIEAFGRAKDIFLDGELNLLLKAFDSQTQLDDCANSYILGAGQLLRQKVAAGDMPDPDAQEAGEPTVGPDAIPEERQRPRLVDEADLLDDAEEEALNTILDEVSERQQLDVAICTMVDFGGKEPTAFADDFFDYEGYGYGENDDGILFAIDMTNRDWAISTYGYAITAFTDYGQEYMTDQFLPYLSDGDYYTAFAMYAALCDELITQAKDGQPLDSASNVGYSFFIDLIPFSLVIGFIIAFFNANRKKKRLKSVVRHDTAGNYTRPGSMQLWNSNDVYLGRFVTKRRIKEQSSGSSGGGSSTHTSSSGRSHGGSSGKF